ncbi:PH domain-containing protein [Photobacterium leiognathi]|uniref:PH domain-containing protein n=1 Tax=Photobacterium leiognathi TaxID=553611 RepID=UPI002981CC3C|nr:PH domain-containing protein [Photobacterium leiognathi]
MFRTASNFINKTLGNSVEIEPSDIREQFTGLISDQEEILISYKLIRDIIIVTDKRFITIDKQGLTGKKVEMTSIPLRSITMITTETKGHLDMESELKLWVSGRVSPIELTFGSSVDITKIQRLLFNHM